MIQVAQDLKALSPLELAQRAEDTAAALEGNANFPSPDPTPAQLRAAAAAVRADDTALGVAQTGVKNARNTLVGSTNKLLALQGNEGIYVQGVANANDNTEAQAIAIVESADMKVKSKGEPVGALPAPEKLALSQGVQPGEVKASCKSIKVAGLYQWEACMDGDPNTGTWIIKKSSTSASATLSGFASGSLPWVRVRAGRGDDLGPASAPVSIRVA